MSWLIQYSKKYVVVVADTFKCRNPTTELVILSHDDSKRINEIVKSVIDITNIKKMLLLDYGRILMFLMNTGHLYRINLQDDDNQYQITNIYPDRRFTNVYNICHPTNYNNQMYLVDAETPNILLHVSIDDYDTILPLFTLDPGSKIVNIVFVFLGILVEVNNADLTGSLYLCNGHNSISRLDIPASYENSMPIKSCRVRFPAKVFRNKVISCTNYIHEIVLMSNGRFSFVTQEGLGEITLLPEFENNIIDVVNKDNAFGNDINNPTYVLTRNGDIYNLDDITQESRNVFIASNGTNKIISLHSQTTNSYFAIDNNGALNLWGPINHFDYYGVDSKCHECIIARRQPQQKNSKKTTAKHTGDFCYRMMLIPMFKRMSIRTAYDNDVTTGIKRFKSAKK